MKVLTFTPTNNDISKDQKIKRFTEEFIGVGIGKATEFNPSGIEEILNMRVYTTSLRIYVCFWLNGTKAVGSGSANGSNIAAAAYKAFKSAGITFDSNISGGESAVKLALNVIMKHQKYKRFILLNSHG